MILERSSRLQAPDAFALDTSSLEFRSLKANYRQQLQEAKIAAEMLVHMYDEADFSMFAIDLIGIENQAPDIQISRLGDQGEVLDQEIIEIVSFTGYSEREGFLAFLGRTKLRPCFAYPSETIILLNVEVSLKNPESAARRISEVLQNSENVRHQMFGLFRNCTKPFVAKLTPEYIIY